ncbi:MAG TPA: Uma2 family endonuclease [Acetobacteraceae bacterium]
MNVTLRPAPPLPAMTREQFLDWDGHLDGHWEFDGSRPIPMTGGSRGHSLIAARLIYALMRRLDRTEWKVLVDAGLGTVGDKVRYPDVQVTRTPSPPFAKLVLGTVAAFEVVSPGSERADRVDKIREYAAVPSIYRYAILEQTAPVLTVLHRRDGGDGWGALPPGAGETLELPELGIAVPVDEIYAGLTFPGDDAPGA